MVERSAAYSGVDVEKRLQEVTNCMQSLMSKYQNKTSNAKQLIHQQQNKTKQQTNNQLNKTNFTCTHFFCHFGLGGLVMGGYLDPQLYHKNEELY